MRKVIFRTGSTVRFAFIYLLCAAHLCISLVHGEGRRSPPLPEPPGQAGPSRLRHLEPAKEWVDGYPIGDGLLGGMVLGGITNDRVALNHSWLWRQAAERRAFHVAGKLPEFRRLFLNGQVEAAGRLMENDIMVSGGDKYTYVNSYQPVGDLLLDLPPSGAVTDYQRVLDMDTGIVEVTYRAGETLVRREYFAAAPADNLMVVRIAVDGPGRISGQVRLDQADQTEGVRTHASQQSPETSVTNGVEGNLLIRAGQFREGFPFAAVARVSVKGGTLLPPVSGSQSPSLPCLTIRDAREVWVVVAMATGHESPEPVGWCRAHLGVISMPFKKLRQRHVEDHQALFRRASLRLEGARTDLPTDQLIDTALRSKQGSPALFQQLFDFGRYLLISGSRPGSLPMNLQGIWNDQSRPPWDSDYHMDLNLEFNYWLAEGCNLSELHQPLFDWAEARIPDGRRLARDLYGCGGVYFPIVGDATGLGNADNLTYCWTGAAGWLAQHFWRHWEFTGDRVFLQRRAYPFLQEVAAFYLDFLVKDPEGNYLVIPSASPENGIKGRSDWMHFATISSTIDLEIAREVFTHLLRASEILNVDADQAGRCREVLAHLPMPTINNEGRLLEWSEAVEAEDPAHRHLSPLYGLYPGDRVSVTDTGQWTEAARKLLEYRLRFGSGSANGWSYPWRAALFARLGQGNLALGQLDDLARSCVNENLLTLITDWRGQGLTIGWFGGKKVFQIEAGLATTAAMAEMLMQSQGGLIRVLPGLPDRWSTGRVAGLVARGGFVVGIDWSGGSAHRVRVHSRLGQVCRVKIDHPHGELSLLSGGRPVSFLARGDGVVEFQTRTGGDYDLRVGKEDR